MEPIAADEMVIEYVGQNIRQVNPEVLSSGEWEGWLAGHHWGPQSLSPS